MAKFAKKTLAEVIVAEKIESVHSTPVTMSRDMYRKCSITNRAKYTAHMEGQK